MRYEEFRDRLKEAIQGTDLSNVGPTQPSETIDLYSTDRVWRMWIGPTYGREAEPFHVFCRIRFRWSPLNASRSDTCEEDLLTELYGREGYSTHTVPSLIRVDISLRASLPYGSTTPMLLPEIWRSWSDSVEAGLDEALPRADTYEEQSLLPVVRGGRGDVEVEARCSEGGELSLAGLSVSAFRLVPVPRVWDDPDKREEEPDFDDHLVELADRIKEAVERMDGDLDGARPLDQVRSTAAERGGGSLRGRR